jgi:Ricin-type beta-trefoil lectin domain-like
MFTFDRFAARAPGESHPRPDQPGVAFARRSRGLRRAAVGLAIGSSLLVSAVDAGSALADQYPPGSPYGTQVGVVANDSTPKGQVDTLTNTDTGLVADDPNGSGSVGTQMIQWPANGGYNQNWVVIPAGAYGQIENRQSGLCLDETSRETQNAPVTQSSCADTVSQQWKLVTQSGGTSIVNAGTGGYLAVAGGESNEAPGAGTGLVQDIDHQNHANVWTLSPVSYRVLTDKELAMGYSSNDPPALYYYSSVQDETTWTCQSGYHFRMASAGTYSDGHWVTFPQAAIDQAEGPQTAVSPTNNQISTQQGPDGGYFPYAGYSGGTDEAGLQQPISWTDAPVSSPGSSGLSDSDPAGANAGYGSVSIGYGYTTAFQGQDLEAQVILHCDPN